MGRKHRQGKRIFQDSPFLELPGEIRMLIYEAALIKPTSIDLWPHKYVETPDEDPTLVARISKASEEYETRRLSDRRGIHLNRWVPRFRRQDDLQYVRKKMATGLLATCKQICREATPIFWRKNTFRFSGDTEWLGVRRFLDSIGPEAICRLRKLEVFVPLEYNPWIAGQGANGEPVENWDVIRHAKNTPKLHMAKAGLNVKGDRDVEENMEIVTSLLTKAMATLDLHFVLPRGFVLNSASLLRGWGSDLELAIPFPEELQLKSPFTKVTVIIEPGAVVYGENAPERITSNGADFILMPGSFWKQAINTSDEEAKISETKIWKSNIGELELLDGLQELMKEKDDAPTVPGRGGKANKSPGPKKVERVLKGFGESESSLHPNTPACQLLIDCAACAFILTFCFSRRMSIHPQIRV
jgi:hypothetical protein